MFLALPIEIKEHIFHSLDIMSQAKLYMALPKSEKIQEMDPAKHTFLRLLAKLVKVKGYSFSNELYGDWKEFIIDYPDDPTVNHLLTVHPNQWFTHDMKFDKLSETKVYNLEFTDSIFYYDPIFFDLAKYASVNGFKTMEKNPSTKSIIASMFTEESTQRLFWYDLIEANNTDLLHYISNRFTFDMNEMINSLVMAYSSLARVRTLCEFYKIDKTKIESIFIRALDECQFDIVEYLDSKLT